MLEAPKGKGLALDGTANFDILVANELEKRLSATYRRSRRMAK